MGRCFGALEECAQKPNDARIRAICSRVQPSHQRRSMHTTCRKSVTRKSFSTNSSDASGRSWALRGRACDISQGFRHRLGAAPGLSRGEPCKHRPTGSTPASSGRRLCLRGLSRGVGSASMPQTFSIRDLHFALALALALASHQRFRCIREAGTGLGSSDNDGTGAASCQ